MTRSWLFAQLLRPQWTDDIDQGAQVLLARLPEVVAGLRASDSGAHWFFQRLGGLTGASFGLWFYATTEVLATVRQQLEANARRCGWSIAPDVDVRPYLRQVPPDLRLASAASDLALTLLRHGELAARSTLPVAVRHLRHIVEVIAPAQRRPFLFECWRHWAGELASDQRVKLTLLADAEARGITEAAETNNTPPYAEAQSDPWSGYRGALDRLTRTRAGGALNYVLFHTAHATHNRLAIPAADQALAALVVRAVQRPATGADR